MTAERFDGARIGLYGGTFDPIHYAHLRMAEAAASQCGLAQVFVVPASHPPHREAGARASYEDRFRMVQIACADRPLFSASRLEEGPDISYSIRTVERFRLGLSGNSSLYYVIGADAFAEIRSWFRWRDLAALVTFAVVGRPGVVYEIPNEVCACRVDGVNLPISSSDIRAVLAAGGVPEDLPPGVLSYIRERSLYSDA